MAKVARSRNLRVEFSQEDIKAILIANARRYAAVDIDGEPMVIINASDSWNRDTTATVSWTE